jgi:multiple sugar transport system permease protein
MRVRGGASGGARATAEWRFGVLAILPALLVFCAVILRPFVESLWLALHEYTVTMPGPEFVGLANLERLLGDAIFRDTWLRTVFFVIATTGATLVLGTAWALVLNDPFRGRGFLRSASLIPWVLPSTVTALLWVWVLHGQYGLLNAVLLSTRLIATPIFWLSTEWGAMAAIVIAKSWLSTPVVMVFVLAGLATLPLDQVEAARLDGAGNATLLRYIVLPHLRPVLLIVAVLQAMGNLQQFDVIYAMTGGGPVRATTVMSIEVYRDAFQDWNLGLACAVGVVWFLTIAIPAAYYLRTIARD